MRNQIFHTIRTTILVVVALGLFHIARPVAVFAQTSASVGVEVTVLPADAAWAGHRMAGLVAQAAEGQGPAREEELGTVVWREDAHAEVRVVTVAHLAN